MYGYMTSMRNKLFKHPIRFAVVATPDPSRLYSLFILSRLHIFFVCQPSLPTAVAYVAGDSNTSASAGSAPLSNRQGHCHELDVKVLFFYQRSQHRLIFLRASQARPLNCTRTVSLHAPILVTFFAS
jgi:hypothetical protein